MIGSLYGKLVLGQPEKPKWYWLQSPKTIRNLTIFGQIWLFWTQWLVPRIQKKRDREPLLLYYKYQTLSTLEGVQFCMFVTEVVQLNFNGLRKLPILSGLGRCSANLTIFNIICWVDCLISQASDVPSFDCPRSKPATHLDTCVTLQPSISYILTIFNIIYWVNGLLEQSSHRPSV